MHNKKSSRRKFLAGAGGLAGTGWLALNTTVLLAAAEAAAETAEEVVEEVVDVRLGRVPSMKQAMTDVVHLYSLARWEASLIQDDISSYLDLRDWLANPTAGKYSALNQRLFATLVDEKLVETPSLELFRAPDHRR